MSRASPPPFAVSEAFGDAPLPPRILSAQVLTRLDLLDEAYQRVLAELEEAADRESVEECLRAKAALEVYLSNPWEESFDRTRKRPDDERDRAQRALVGTLRRLLEEADGPTLRRRAWEVLSRLAESKPAVRRDLAERLLREHAEDPPAHIEVLASWKARLAADTPEERDAHSEELLGMCDAALPILAGLLRSRDPEVRERAREIVEELARP